MRSGLALALRWRCRGISILRACWRPGPRWRKELATCCGRLEGGRDTFSTSDTVSCRRPIQESWRKWSAWYMGRWMEIAMSDPTEESDDLDWRAIMESLANGPAVDIPFDNEKEAARRERQIAKRAE